MGAPKNQRGSLAAFAASVSFASLIPMGAIALAGCSASDGDVTDSGEPSQAKKRSLVDCRAANLACTCANGAPSTRVCSNGQLGDCDCGPSASTAARCNDLKCDPNETCETCPSDCGACTVCEAAPSCDHAGTPPTTSPEIAKLNVELGALSRSTIRDEWASALGQPSFALRAFVAALAHAPAAGEARMVTHMRELLATQPALFERARGEILALGLEPESFRQAFPARAPSRLLSNASLWGDCAPPQLRVGLTEITVIEEDDDFSNDVVFCAIAADSPGGSELRVTAPTRALDQGESQSFSWQQGSVWGQAGPRETGGALKLSYTCFEDDSDGAGYRQLLAEVAKVAASRNQASGEGSWLDAAGIIGQHLPRLLALSEGQGDVRLFVASQEIEAEDILSLTRGGRWKVHKSGSRALVTSWDWSLSMQAWGCARNGK